VSIIFKEPKSTSPLMTWPMVVAGAPPAVPVLKSVPAAENLAMVIVD
jgi:hypothetical protein